MEIGRRFYVITANGEVGPISQEDIQHRVMKGELSRRDVVRTAFGQNLGTVGEILDKGAPASDRIASQNNRESDKFSSPTTSRRRTSDRRAKVPTDRTAKPSVLSGVWVKRFGILIIVLMVIGGVGMWFKRPPPPVPMVTLSKHSPPGRNLSEVDITAIIDQPIDRALEVFVRIDGLSEHLACTPSATRMVIPPRATTATLSIHAAPGKEIPTPPEKCTVQLVADATYRGDTENSLTVQLGIPLPLDHRNHAVAAYSTRRLRSDYLGPLVRIRSTSASQGEQDFFPDKRGWLSMSSPSREGIMLREWIGAERGFVTTWYDQSGEDHHAVAPWLGAEPLIADRGDVVRMNGAPVLLFNGVNALMYNKPITVNLRSQVIQTVSGERVSKDTAGILCLIPADGDDWNTPGGFAIGTGYQGKGIEVGYCHHGFDTAILAAKPAAFAIRTWQVMNSESTVQMNVASHCKHAFYGLGNEHHSEQFTDANQGFLIGSRWFKGINSVFALDGHIGELIVFSPHPGAATVQLVEQSQASAFGLPLTSAPVKAPVAESVGSSNVAPSADMPFGGSSNGQTSGSSSSAQTGSAKGSTIPILDQLSTKPASAYGIRQLISSYNGPLLRVRRDDSNGEQDIGSQSNGELDSAALRTFMIAGGNLSGQQHSVYVTTWYDQMGAANLFNANKSSQPRLADAGTIEIANGKPTLRFFGKDEDVNCSVLSRTPAEHNCLVAAVLAATNGFILSANKDQHKFHDNHWENKLFGDLSAPCVSQGTCYLNGVTYRPAASAPLLSYPGLTVVSLVTEKPHTPTYWDNIGCDREVHHHLSGTYSELIVFDSEANNQDRARLEANQRSYFMTP